MKVLVARHVVPVESEPLSPGWVGIVGDRIAALGSGPPPAGAVVEDLGEAALLPGLVDAHTHLGCGFLKGAGDGLGFLDWIDSAVAPAVIRALGESPDELDRAARAGARELLQGGVTCVADSFVHDGALPALADLGLRGVFFREHFGAASEDLDAHAERVRERIAADAASPPPTALLRRGLAPHALYTCPPAVLAVVVEQARRRGLPISIHLAESREEHAFFSSGSGPMADRFAPGERRDRYEIGGSPVAVAERLGLLAAGTLLVHMVQIDAEDVARVARAGASVVHCPTSNLRLGVGLAPIAELRAAGVNVALGTDSAASVGKLDMFEEMRLAVLGQRARTGNPAASSAAEVLEMATLNGARALGLEDEIGSLVPGKAADLVAVTLDRPRHRPIRDPVGTVVWSCTPDDVVGVWVAGRRLLGARER